MKKMVWIAGLVFLSLVLASTGKASMDVFVSIAPQKWLAAKVGGNMVSVHVLVPAGQEPEDFEPTPKQVAILAKSSVWFTVGMPFEKQLVERVRPSATKLKIIDSTQDIKKFPMVGHDEHHQQRAGQHPGADRDELEGIDPHVWLSPPNLQKMGATMATAMIAADPDHRQAYEGNLSQLKAELEQLHRRIAAQLAPFAGSRFFVFHPAFGYFARTYNLQQEAVEIEGKSPTPRQLSGLIEQARAEKVKVIFVQPQFDQKSAKVVASAIGGRVVPLDPLAENVAENLQVMADRIESALKKQ